MRSPFDVLRGKVDGFSTIEVARRTVPCYKYVYEPGVSTPALSLCLLVDSKFLYRFPFESLKGIPALEAKARYLSGEMATQRLREFQPGYCRYEKASIPDGSGVDGKVRIKPELNLVYEIARTNLTDQLGLLFALDSKLGTMLTGGTAMMALAVAVFAVASNRVGLAQVLLLAAAAVPYASLFWHAVGGLLIRDWSLGPPVNSVIREYVDQTTDGVRLIVIRELRDAFNSNQGGSLSKQDALLHSGWALGLTAISVGVTLLSLVFNR